MKEALSFSATIVVILITIVCTAAIMDSPIFGSIYIKSIIVIIAMFVGIFIAAICAKIGTDL